jgi:hypothetical protein
MFDHIGTLESAVAALKREQRYRVFAGLELKPSRRGRLRKTAYSQVVAANLERDALPVRAAAALPDRTTAPA